MAEDNETIVLNKDLNEYNKIRDMIIEKCKTKNIAYSIDKSFRSEELLVLEIPNGRNKRKLNVWSTESAQKFLELPFENYTFIGDYESICDYNSGYLECIIEPLDRVPSHHIYRRLFGKDTYSDDFKEDELKRTLTDPSHTDITIEISIISEELQYFSQYRGRPRRILSLKIWSPKLKQHDIALSYLEKISNSIFFQIDILMDLPLTLAKSRYFSFRPVRRRLPDETPQVVFPKYEYYEAPISLYWYARSAVRMPLLQFLAFYQSIEYFFPLYSQEEAKRKIRNILKDESFRTEKDSDIVKILTAIKSNSSNTFGDERSQLRATLLECIDPAELRSFLIETEERKEFFSKATKGITKHKIPINNETLDLRNDIAERLYDIRCKIVHTKADGKETEIDILLPFSKEAELLYNDIELINFLAKRIIIASSVPLNI